MKSLFSYETFKTVRVQDKRLGVLYRSFQLAIFAYIISTIIINEGYFKKELPSPGAIRITLQAPNNFDTPDYCHGDVPCVYWGANDIQYPNDGAGVAFFATRVKVNKFDPPNNCNFLTASAPNDPCIFNPNNYTPVVNISYIADIETYTMMIEHSIRGHTTDMGIRNGLNGSMDGSLVDINGKVIKSWNSTTRKQDDPRADGDIMTVQQLLTAAGADLQAVSTAPGAKPGEIYRSSGIVIVIVIDYKNVPFKEDTITYTYRPQYIKGNEYKSIESIYQPNGGYVIKERHGLRLVFQQSGTIGKFDFISLLKNIVAGFALFSLASIIVEILMLQFLPEKSIYEQAKFENTHDIYEHQKLIKQGIISNNDETLAKESVGNEIEIIS
ncbi:4787_t:CDS:10 [Ambispora leptoticha]|uniref:4787_t:CDS:1 n=1 Tax=Ambispora leptoticha TaxID=144679 RepID=A0A9N9CQ55_9GLOM|nr:4787_t:CDS:10 [Ambispora leptoticha]